MECLTDNRNRAASDVHTAFSRNGGSMADPGSVAYLFRRKGVIVVEKKGVTEDDMVAAVLDTGAEEVNDLGESFEVVSEPSDLVATRAALQDAGIDYDSADMAFLPSVEIDLDEEQARRVFRLINALEDSDDVQDVYANYSVSDDIIDELSCRPGSGSCPTVVVVADGSDATPVLIRHSPWAPAAWPRCMPGPRSPCWARPAWPPAARRRTTRPWTPRRLHARPLLIRLTRIAGASPIFSVVLSICCLIPSAPVFCHPFRAGVRRGKSIPARRVIPGIVTGR